MYRSRQQVATKSWSGGRDGESSSAQAQAQAQEVSVRSQAGRQAEQSLLPCTTRPGRECGGRQITRGDSDAVVLLPVGASSRHPTPKRAARGGTGGPNCSRWAQLHCCLLGSEQDAFCLDGVLFFLLVRALCFTYTDHAMQFAGIRLRPVCPPLRCRFGKPKVWSGLDGRFFSFTHIGPVGIIDDGLQKTATTVGPNLVTPVGFRPYASGLAWPGLDPALASHPAPAYVWSTRRWLVNFPAGKYVLRTTLPRITRSAPFPPVSSRGVRRCREPVSLPISTTEETHETLDIGLGLRPLSDLFLISVL
jgi:hypothetical protein